MKDHFPPPPSARHLSTLQGRADLSTALVLPVINGHLGAGLIKWTHPLKRWHFPSKDIGNAARL